MTSNFLKVEEGDRSAFSYIFDHSTCFSLLLFRQLNYHVVGIKLKAREACDSSLLVFSVLNRESYLPAERGEYLATLVWVFTCWYYYEEIVSVVNNAGWDVLLYKLIL